MSKLLLIEPHASGHHMQHVRRIVREGSRLGIQIQLLTSRESLSHTSYQAIQEEFAGQFETVFLPSDALAARFLRSSNLFIKQLGYYRYFQKYYHQLTAAERPKVIFIPYLDYIDKAAAFLGSPFGRTPWSGLPMQIKFHYTTMGASRPAARIDNLNKKAYLRLLKNSAFQSMFTIDELLYEYTKQYHPSLAKKLVYVGDPVDIVSHKTRALARQRFGLPEASKVLLVYGMLSLRKGIQPLISAMQAPNFPQEICVFLAGTQQEEVKPLLSSPAVHQLRSQNRIYEMNKYLTMDDEGDAFKASDIVWVGYKNFYGMSGVMIQAGYMGLPIIACREGLIGWMTRKHQTGLDIDSESPQEIATAINSLVSNPDIAAAYGENGVRLAENCTSEAFANTICTTLMSGKINNH